MSDDLQGDEQERSARRAQKIEEMRREKEKQQKQREQIKKYAPIAGGVAGAIILIAIGIGAVTGHKDSAAEPQITAEVQSEEQTTTEVTSEEISGTENVTEASMTETATDADSAVTAVYSAHTTDETTTTVSEVVSENVILIEESTGDILTQKAAYTRISPASMTKILTVLVAAEHVTDLKDTYTITLAETDYSYSNDCSNAGFDVDEIVTIEDLFYGTILPSGADAAVALATYVAGSHEAFVEMMNEKLDELGLSDTAHVTNCVGLYDEEHYCTVYDMAMILKAAMDNPLCREVMSAHTYTTSVTTQHPEGILLSNWFLRRIEDKDCGGEVLCAKTGYVVQSGNCAASYCLDADGNGYLCVTAHSTSSWHCIYDHVALYSGILMKESQGADE